MSKNSSHSVLCSVSKYFTNICCSVLLNLSSSPLAFTFAKRTNHKVKIKATEYLPEGDMVLLNDVSHRGFSSIEHLNSLNNTLSVLDNDSSFATKAKHELETYSENHDVSLGLGLNYYYLAI